MKRLAFLCIAIMLLIYITVPTFADGSVQPNGLPDVFPRTADVGDLKAAPLVCFNSPGSENGLKGLACYLVGKVISLENIPFEENKVCHGFTIQTEYGDALVIDMYSYTMEYEATTQELKAYTEEPESDYTLPEVGAFIKVVCLYSGYSDVFKMPLFYYGTPRIYLEYFSESKSDNRDQQYKPTIGETNALNKAYQYLNVMAFSRSGLIAQLEYDGFSTAEATYAADNCYEDWNEQAASKAEQYLSIMGFSKEGLISQLEHDGFTREQAVYGAEQNGY